MQKFSISSKRERASGGGGSGGPAWLRSCLRCCGLWLSVPPSVSLCGRRWRGRAGGSAVFLCAPVLPLFCPLVALVLVVFLCYSCCVGRGWRLRCGARVPSALGGCRVRFCFWCARSSSAVAVVFLPRPAVAPLAVRLRRRRLWPGCGGSVVCPRRCCCRLPAVLPAVGGVAGAAALLCSGRRVGVRAVVGRVGSACAAAVCSPALRGLVGWFSVGALAPAGALLCGVPVFASRFSSVGFGGSRSCSGPVLASVVGLAGAAAAAGAAVFVASAAGGVSAAVGAAVPGAVVFSPSFSGPGALAARASAFVRALAAAPSPLLVLAPCSPCPAGLLPARSWVACGSGSWSEAALSFGLGCPVFVVGLPLAALPAWAAPLPGRLAGVAGFFLVPPAPVAAPRLPGF